ncbi:hypothetical protein ACJJTC_012989 [Scirpophaga incertulas]
MRARVAARGKAARHAPSSAALSSASRIDKYLSFRSRLPRLLVLVIRNTDANNDCMIKYPFIKKRKDDSADVTCEKCRTDFSVGHGGASDIEKHLKSEKHRLADQAAASSSSMLNFFKKTDSPISKDLDIAAAEQHNHTSFHEVVLKIEGQNVSAIESAKEINRLRDNLALKENTIFLPHVVRNLLGKLQEEAAVDQQNVRTAAAEFYKTSREYLEQWCQFNKELEVFEWANLTKVPTWEEVQKVLDLLITQGFISSSQDTKVFDEFSLVLNFATDEKISGWNVENVCTANRWVELFQHFRANNLDVTNFSMLIDWSVAVMKAILITKININKSCTEFHTYLKTRPDILKQICSADKYKN